MKEQFIEHKFNRASLAMAEEKRMRQELENFATEYEAREEGDEE